MHKLVKDILTIYFFSLDGMGVVFSYSKVMRLDKALHKVKQLIQLHKRHKFLITLIGELMSI